MLEESLCPDRVLMQGEEQKSKLLLNCRSFKTIKGTVLLQSTVRRTYQDDSSKNPPLLDARNDLGLKIGLSLRAGDVLVPAAKISEVRTSMPHHV